MTKPWVHWSTDCIGFGGATISVVFFSSRSRPTLIVHHPDHIDPVAYFRDEVSALEFCEIMTLEVHYHE